MTAFTIAADLWDATRRAWPTPGALAHDLDPRTKQTPALTLIDSAIVDTYQQHDGRLLLSMPPQEGKSQRVSRWFPLWVLTRNPDTRIAIVSYEADVARRWGRQIRDDITQYSDQLGGLRVRDDLSAQHEWGLAGSEGGVYTVGIGGALTGRPVDLLIIDDPVKDATTAASRAYQTRLWDWWTGTASARLAPGASVIQIATRWHDKDLAGQLLAAEDGGVWRVLNIPAQAETDDDPLGRPPGEYLISARHRTTRQWDAIKRRVGPRVWAALYQGRPSPEAGGVFKRDAWARYEQPMWVERGDGARIIPGLETTPDTEMCQSWDFAFKDSDTSDYVVGQVWLRRGPNVYLLDQVRARLDFNASCDAIRGMSARWPQAVAKLVEDKANGPAILNALRATLPGLVPIEPEGSKYARAVAVSPLHYSGNILLPDTGIAPWVADLIEEAAAFPNGAHDDTVDAMSQAVHRLLLVPIIDGAGTGWTDDILGDDDDYDGGLTWTAAY